MPQQGFRFDNVRLLVTDVARSFRYYRDVFGFEPHEGDEHGDLFASLGVDDHVDIGLYRRGLQPAADSGEPMGDRGVIVLVVDDVDASVAALVGRGADLASPPTNQDWGGRTAHIRDPDGNLIELLGPMQG